MHVTTFNKDLLKTKSDAPHHLGDSEPLSQDGEATKHFVCNCATCALTLDPVPGSSLSGILHVC